MFYGAAGKLPGTQQLAVPAGALTLIVKAPDPNHPGSYIRLAEISLSTTGITPADADWLLAAGDQVWADYQSGSLRALERVRGIVCDKHSPLVETIDRFQAQAQSRLPILVLGERGVGKTALARELHQLSGRSGKCNYVNCASFASSEGLAASVLFGLGRKSGLPEVSKDGEVGFLERSHNGVLLLDEFHTIPLSIQNDLLPVVTGGEFRKVGGDFEARKVNIRFVFATNEDPRELVENGKLLVTLYDRINTIQIRIPPLRERRRDIPVLIDHFCKAQNPRVQIARDLFLAMLWHDWPDNVRGLEKLIEAASAWPGPDPLRLADLDELSINPSIVEALRGAYAAYVSAANAGRLGLREEQLASLISEIGATMFEQIFARSGQAIKGPVASWRDLVGKGMGNLRARLPTLGYDPATLAAATNCAQLLEACGLDKVTVRRTLSQAFAGLGSRDVPLSCGREQPRYAALESFFGLTHNKLRYSPRGRRGRAQGRNKANL